MAPVHPGRGGRSAARGVLLWGIRSRRYADPNGGQDCAPSNVAFSYGRHTATTQWLPGSVKYYLDGSLVGNFATDVSSYPMHWVLQSESSFGARPTGAGHIKID